MVCNRVVNWYLKPTHHLIEIWDQAIKIGKEQKIQKYKNIQKNMNTQIHLTPAHQLIETWHQAIKIWQGSENTEMQQLWRRRNATDMSAISTKLSQTENARIARNRRNAIFAKLVVSLCLNLTFIQILKTQKNT